MPSDPIADKPLYPSSSPWGIPDLPYAPLSAVPNWLVPYRTRLRGSRAEAKDGAVHFFLYDAIFESVWNCPSKSARYLDKFNVLLAPDFSLNADMPLALQAYNVYRSRWCAAHWTANGHTAIPTVGWSTPESYAFCFDGIAQHSVVALTTLGTRRRKSDFLSGFYAMLVRIQPSRILCYGDPFPEMERFDLRVYPTRYHLIQAGSDG
ncbi:MAG: DUF4417 domain-containing protein [Chloroflexota bacterium]